MSWSNDPIADFNRYDKEQQRELEKRPKCVLCGEHIQDDDCFVICNDIICEDCLNDNHRRSTEDFIED